MSSSPNSWLLIVLLCLIAPFMSEEVCYDAGQNCADGKTSSGLCSNPFGGKDCAFYYRMVIARQKFPIVLSDESDGVCSYECTTSSRSIVREDDMSVCYDAGQDCADGKTISGVCSNPFGGKDCAFYYRMVIARQQFPIELSGGSDGTCSYVCTESSRSIVAKAADVREEDMSVCYDAGQDCADGKTSSGLCSNPFGGKDCAFYYRMVIARQKFPIVLSDESDGVCSYECTASSRSIVREDDMSVCYDAGQDCADGKTISGVCSNPFGGKDCAFYYRMVIARQRFPIELSGGTDGTCSYVCTTSGSSRSVEHNSDVTSQYCGFQCPLYPMVYCCGAEELESNKALGGVSSFLSMDTAFVKWKVPLMCMFIGVLVAVIGMKVFKKFKQQKGNYEYHTIDNTSSTTMYQSA